MIILDQHLLVKKVYIMRRRKPKDVEYPGV